MDCPWKRPKNVRKSNEFCPMDCPRTVHGWSENIEHTFILPKIRIRVLSYYNVSLNFRPSIGLSVDCHEDCPCIYHNRNLNLYLKTYLSKRTGLLTFFICDF